MTTLQLCMLSRHYLRRSWCTRHVQTWCLLCSYLAAGWNQNALQRSCPVHVAYCTKQAGVMSLWPFQDHTKKQQKHLINRLNHCTAWTHPALSQLHSKWLQTLSPWSSLLVLAVWMHLSSPWAKTLQNLNPCTMQEQLASSYINSTPGHFLNLT